MSFDLSYLGDRPVLLYVFQAPRSVAEQGCKPGAFALLRPGAKAEIHHPEPMEILAIAYDGDRPLDLGDPDEPIRGATDPGVRLLAQEIRRVLREEDGSDPRYVESLAESLLLRAQTVAASPQLAAATRALTPHKLRRLTAFIDANLDRTLPVAELAAVVGLSRAHFTRAFQSAVGESPHRFVLSRRLEEVRLGLEQGAEDLAVLAVRHGFSSHAHMSSAFRAAYGATPSSYRRTVAADGADDPLALAAS
ncbi:MAG: AraC family transcriptional regulator [Alphaproteobacteria bacterium]|nr:AraC family transcriptional regulator [Alphaproteobacteria bacterium]MBU1515357.1 AraC family transcriptional regulator [Alphaproteobacteria bacterium]MBU2095407.1 AraC family transcriptional regulator [Alphaproteobacteria bacterium]MBU2152573.1 AraC family transcriptional regulator [Alphaproteobacteria bacterium]MBU2309969.1 AraC family transcriptional regulator [Alphaproteobacteria bacterium]